MTHYAMRNGLSFCRVGEHLVFLDIDNDRYFRLPQAMERALLAHLDGDGPADLDISGLIASNVLVDDTPGIEERPSIEPAARSAMEAPTPSRRLRPSELLEVFAIVLYTRFQLKSSTLRTVLAGLAPDRRSSASRVMLPSESVEPRLSEVAAAFRRARPYVPLQMRCLLDSVAMAKFLRRRRLDAHVVFGVALDPFSAHCWVQAGDLVLNDTVGNVSSHTPLRVV
ncbi:lasso peptide biosynthesis B2 protein [Xanthomonas sp. AmX2]|uniref:lasso peptide biosynthesis B2 protein n=1 Tax=Xanthomonas sp. TaxID=29446 RepID=UPI00197DD5A4|nr:lasso peptide biosynthesis B2 protein [Xanthomonas sp.]MBN6150771.1 lasso peptide biosynthesis B2 protein [Xanthomonas sp.]